MSQRYALPLDEELCDLVNTLQGYVIRDLPQNWTRETYTESRNKAMNDRRAILTQAADVRDALRRLRTRAKKFGDDYEWQPTIMGDIFNLDFGPPDNLFLPAGLDPLQNLIERDDFWSEVEKELHEVATIPARRRPGGGAANTVVVKMVGLCRAYWTGHRRRHGDGWIMKRLTDAETQSDFARLETPAERFLVDALHTAGAEFTPEDLRRAWRPRQVTNNRRKN